MIATLISRSKQRTSQSFNSVRDDLCDPAQRQLLVFMACSLMVFLIYKMALLNPAKQDGQIITMAGAFVFALLGSSIRSTACPVPMLVILRAISCLFGVYILVSFPTYSISAGEHGNTVVTAFFLDYARYIGALAAFVSWFRPSWGLVTLGVLLWYKGVAANILMLPISSTDYLPLVEMSCFFILSSMLWYRGMKIEKFASLAIFNTKVITKENTELSPLEKLTLLGITAHLANYLYSGLKKIWIGETPFDWVLENKTQNLLLAANELGQLPLGFSEELSVYVFQVLEQIVVPNNALIFLAQLSAIVVVWRVRWALWATLFYDLTHTVIFIVSGIFFYKWIILNLAIVVALRSIQNKVISPLLALTLMGFMIVSPLVFSVAKLGWWDTPALNVERFYAITKGGDAIAVPVNYWGAFSVRAAQQRIIWRKQNGFLPTGTYGITFGAENVRRAFSCNYELDDKHQVPNAIDDAFEKGIDSNISIFVRSYHQWVLGQAGENRNWNYNLYPHHIFSFPWRYDEFRALDIHDVVAYRYSIRSVCEMGAENGRFVSKTLTEGSYDIFIE